MKNQKDMTDKKDMEKRFDKQFKYKSLKTGEYQWVSSLTETAAMEIKDFINREIQSAIHKTEKRMIEEIEKIVIDGGSVTFNLKVWGRIKKLLNHSKQG